MYNKYPSLNKAKTEVITCLSICNAYRWLLNLVSNCNEIEMYDTMLSDQIPYLYIACVEYVSKTTLNLS